MLNAAAESSLFITRYGEILVNLLPHGEESEELAHKANSLRTVQLTARSLCNHELPATWVFTPLDHFMGKADYANLLERIRLAELHTVNEIAEVAIRLQLTASRSP